PGDAGRAKDGLDPLDTAGDRTEGIHPRRRANSTGAAGRSLSVLSACIYVAPKRPGVRIFSAQPQNRPEWAGVNLQPRLTSGVEAAVARGQFVRLCGATSSPLSQTIVSSSGSGPIRVTNPGRTAAPRLRAT